MKKMILALVFGAGAFSDLGAAEVPAFIKNMAGCFKITYRFVEDGPHDEYIPETLERVDLSETNGVYSLQRYGIIENESMKHFREDWSAVANKDGALEWTQKVFSPNGAFRYECSSTLNFNQFQCESKAAPKPRRDRHRNDYKTLDRSTRVQVTPLGYVQSEINLKLDESGKAIASEVGWIEFKRVPAKECELKSPRSDE